MHLLRRVFRSLSFLIELPRIIITYQCPRYLTRRALSFAHGGRSSETFIEPRNLQHPPCSRVSKALALFIVADFSVHPSAPCCTGAQPCRDCGKLVATFDRPFGSNFQLNLAIRTAKNIAETCSKSPCQPFISFIGIFQVNIVTRKHTELVNLKHNY